jgi:MoaA/NifB/PqqE/SkfB family radical SAM enzyme
MEEKVIKTQKGLFIRNNKDFGALVFSPFSGLFFAISKEYVADTVNYCNNKTTKLPDEIIKILNIGQNPQSEKNFEIISHWLPNKESFSYIDNEFPDKYPIVINWLISNKCFFKCNYCYAGDVIDKEFEMVETKLIAEKILSLNPLAVVLSGGEPLREKEKILDALSILGNKVGIIIDTNGYNYDEELTNLFKKYNVVVRVSLDSLHNELNNKIRPLGNKNQDNNVLMKIIQNIAEYKKSQIPVLIHTVVSSINKNSLDDLYNKLPSLGINGWRIFSVINPNDKDRKERFEKMMTHGKVRNIEEAQIDIQKKISIFNKSLISKSNFSVQIIHSNESKKNSVILMLPDGKLVTESLFRQEKTEIKKESIFKKVDLREHYERYLGKI